ncbi:uncharacterized protein LOC134250237 [Saccostrea cucullata]|uniref:uncharacterized protein LOC134250237 n=1 Tax=Saccostrea cuccullata TaxID=36930 RepID=UPI002ED405F1
MAAAEKIKLVKETNTGVIVGVGIGCFIFGFVVSLGIILICKQRKNTPEHKDFKNAVDNRSYEKHIEITSSGQTPYTKKASHLPSTIKDATYSNMKSVSLEAKDDIYNHLNEKGKATVDLDDYDHASRVMEEMEPDENYSHLAHENGSLENTDPYFSLENHLS